MFSKKITKQKTNSQIVSTTDKKIPHYPTNLYNHGLRIQN